MNEKNLASRIDKRKIENTGGIFNDMVFSLFEEKKEFRFQKGLRIRFRKTETVCQ